MSMTDAGIGRFYKGGLVSETAYLAFFVGGNEVAGNNYLRKAAAADLWTVAGNKLYLTENLGLPIPSGDWGTIDTVKLMSAAAGGDVLAEWSGNQFSLVDGNGDALAQIESGMTVFVQGGAANGLSITVPLA